MDETLTIEQIHALSIEKAKPHVAKLDAEGLSALRALETADGEDKARAGMIELIDAAEAALKPDAPAEEAAPQPQSDAELAAIDEALAAAVPDPAAEPWASASRAERIDMLVAAVTAARGAPPEAEEKEPEPTPEPELGGHLAIVFRDGPTVIETIRAVPVGGDLRPAGEDAVIFGRTITLVADGPRVEVSAADLVDVETGETLASCQIIPVMRAGAGNEASFPAGHLKFAVTAEKLGAEEPSS